MGEKIINRLFIYLKQKGIPHTRFEKEIGLSNGYLKTQERRCADLGEGVLSKIIDYCLDINISWLLTGRGSMLSNETNQPSQLPSRHLIPLYDIAAIGGREYEADLSSVSQSPSMIDTGDWFLDASAAMSVQGDSMSPEYKSGSIVALKEIRDRRIIMFGEDYVVETDEIRVIKRLQRSDKNDCLLACSINPEIWESGPLKGRLIHEPFDIPLEAVRRMFLVLGEVRRNHSFNIINVTQ